MDSTREHPYEELNVVQEIHGHVKFAYTQKIPAQTQDQEPSHYPASSPVWTGVGEALLLPPLEVGHILGKISPHGGALWFGVSLVFPSHGVGSAYPLPPHTIPTQMGPEQDLKLFQKYTNTLEEPFEEPALFKRFFKGSWPRVAMQAANMGLKAPGPSQRLKGKARKAVKEEEKHVVGVTEAETSNATNTSGNDASVDNLVKEVESPSGAKQWALRAVSAIFTEVNFFHYLLSTPTIGATAAKAECRVLAKDAAVCCGSQMKKENIGSHSSVGLPTWVLLKVMHVWA
ncbi:hypothetical protein K449DRAFT_429422 [Hypoxylon sp. EC38]|nr:hypothetical protein K449DRAFT_429422 [Hypoxylon sp. EC38]